MSLSQRALILIRLDARRCEWVPVEDLAEHLDLSVQVIRERITELWQQGYLQPQWDTAGAGTGTIITGAMATRRLPTCG